MHVMHMARWWRVLVGALVLALPLAGAELPFDVPLATQASQELLVPGGRGLPDGTLTLRFQRDTPSNAQGRSLEALELVLVTADGRYFTTSKPIPVDEDRGETQLPLDAAHWSGDAGSLGPDALAGVRAVLVRVHVDSEGHGRVSGAIDWHAEEPDAPQGLVLPEAGLVDRGPWRELALRLVGRSWIETGEVTLIQGSRRLPFFLDQPMRLQDGTLRPVGPLQWVLRLRPTEQPTGIVRWEDGGRSWESPALPALAVVRTTPLPPVPPSAMPLPLSPAWTGRPWLVSGDAGQLGRRTTLPACLAPILSWNEHWTGFRGGDLVSWTEATACDAALAQGQPEVDLCPQLLLEEHGAFRFGLSPWAQGQGGPWHSERDAWTVAGPWQQWRHHLRNVLARARATPGLARWRLGITSLAQSEHETALLLGFLHDAEQLVSTLDDRPLVVLHPQAVVYGYNDHMLPGNTTGCWFSFEDDTEDWSGGPLPITAPALRDTTMASAGTASLAIPLALSLGRPGERMGGAEVETDSNLFNLDVLLLDVAVSGGGTCQLYLWLTDEDHHWFQQPLALVPGDGRWRTVIADFSDEAPWTGASAGSRWGPAVRRRVRRLGLIGFRHGEPVGQEAPVLHLDRVRRFGFPTMPAPTLALEDVHYGAAHVQRYEPFTADFQLSVPARNPYDPDSADVVAEVQDPAGHTSTWPAYWAEPVRLDFQDGIETPVTLGGGGWHWRYAPTQSGTWRYRLHAHVRWRTSMLETIGDWQQVEVGPPAPDRLAPMRVSLRDPTWFETLDGAFVYPVGINLRSPGDTRQTSLTAQVPPAAGFPGNLNDLQRPLAIRDDREEAAWERMGTRAYERWFTRMHAAGMNWARVWMCSWWCGLEWTRAWDGYGGLTWYNQRNAAQLDRVLDLARQQGIYVQIELMNHGAAGDGNLPDHEWDYSPYSSRNGGMCDSAVDYFARDDAFETQAKRYRYTLARWGWQSHLAAWVLTSEVEWTAAWSQETGGNEDGGRSPSLEKWTKASLAWFREHDAWARPVSIHFSHPWNGTTLWATPGLGFSNSNAYTGFQTMGWGARLGGDGANRDLPLALDLYLETHFPPWRYHRPTIIGEWGGSWDNNAAPATGAELHVGLWLQAVMPYAGDTGFWWWLYVDCANRWDEYRQVSAFVQHDDRRGYAWQVCKPQIMGSHINDQAMGMQASSQIRLYAWLTHLDQQPDLTDPGDAGEALLATARPHGRWRCERWSCQEGKLVATTTLTADDSGRLRIPLGHLTPDAAFRAMLLDP